MIDPNDEDDLDIQIALIRKLHDQIAKATEAREAARAVGDTPVALLHTAYGRQLAELLDAILDGSVTWDRKVPLGTRQDETRNESQG
jgi:hypothetical protein